MRNTLRRRILVDSVQQLLDDGERVNQVAVLWTRHRLFLPYAIAAAVGFFVAALVIGIEGLGPQFGLAIGGAAVATMSTTNYWVLASTNQGADGDLVLCRSSRIRQYAKQIHKRLAPDADIDMLGSTLITSDWRIEGIDYTMTKRWEATVRDLAQR